LQPRHSLSSPSSTAMDASRGCFDSCLNEDDLPQMDGTCDACFGVHTFHGDKHSQSTGHQLQPYSDPDPQPESGARKDCQGDDEQKPSLGANKRDTVTVERLKCKEHGQDGSLYCKHDQRIVCVVEHEIITLKEAYLWQKVSQRTYSNKD
ncbi:hypothetical protein M9458_054113, partial [Cirrhinus mrigala]